MRDFDSFPSAAHSDLRTDRLHAGANPILAGSYYSKGTYALQIDGVGDRVPVFAPLLLVTTDTVADDTGTTATLTVGAPHTISTIDTVGDQDFYAVTLTAGEHYQIGMYGYTGGPGLLPLSDSYIEIYDASGNLVTSGDGGADTPLNAVNSGFDVLLDFIPTASGTYYVNARAFDNVPADGSNGDLVGDYELFVQLAPPGGYIPYYEVADPLYAIDWGSQVDNVNTTVRNPDGDEGIRPTGNPQETPTYGTANGLDVAALAAAQGVDIAGKNVITIYFARAGDVFTSLEDPLSPGLPPATITAVGVQQFERDAVFTALAEFSKVADVVYVEVQDRAQADFVYTSYQGTPGPGVSLLGSMSPPDEPNEGLAQFNSGDYRWNATDLQQGGFSFVTLIHEFGHGHGLAHPHDNGGRSGIMNGVEGEGAGVADYTTGDFALNQGVFTMMSYEDGWQSSPYGNAPTDVGYGYLGGLMAFDIAAIQDKYGVNEEWATGDDLYVLKDVNAAGTYFTSIWDAGGTDTIAYTGNRDATIDLRAATLAYEAGGGGHVSFATGIFGGFTIANKVVIENAVGGEGNDTLIGNAAANALNGQGGNDAMTGGAGDDTYYVAQTGDTVFELAGEGIDKILSRVSFALPDNVEILQLQLAGLTGTGNTLDNTLVGTAGVDVMYGLGGADSFITGGGDDTVYGGDGDDSVWAGAGNDVIDGGAGADIMYGQQGDDIYIVDHAGDLAVEAPGQGTDEVRTGLASYGLRPHIEILAGTSDAGQSLSGNALDNTVKAGAGNDVINGGTGDDAMHGGLGDDTYYVAQAGDTVVEAAGAGTDKVLTRVSFTLSDNVEILQLQVGGLTGTGNALANTLVGSTGADVLRGLAGADLIIAGDGSDMLEGGEGNDALYGGTGNDTVEGGAGNDTLNGADGTDVLRGGAGQDTLFGGNGADTFAFAEAPGAADADLVLDFLSGTDTIELSAGAFGLAAGALPASAFVLGTAAGDGDDRVIYDQASGQLWFDADGSGAGAAVLFATLGGSSHPALAATDFVVV